jgi:hypothetical protein
MGPVARVELAAYDEAFTAALDVRACASAFPRGSAFVSLGQNCSTAWYLQLVGKRACAYPFDWIFSSPQIVEHCLRDDFRAFLDKELLVPVDASCAGHARYHARLFNHRNALLEEHHAHYVRSFGRFRALMDSERPVVFVSTALPEHAARPARRDGFVYDYAAPANVDALSEYEALHALVTARAAPTWLVVIEQRTNRDRARVDVRAHGGDFIVVRFDVCGASNGVNYVHPIDDSLARVLYASIGG